MLFACPVFTWGGGVLLFFSISVKPVEAGHDEIVPTNIVVPLFPPRPPSDNNKSTSVEHCLDSSFLSPHYGAVGPVHDLMLESRGFCQALASMKRSTAIGSGTVMLMFQNG